MLLSRQQGRGGVKPGYESPPPPYSSPTLPPDEGKGGGATLGYESRPVHSQFSYPPTYDVKPNDRNTFTLSGPSNCIASERKVRNSLQYINLQSIYRIN